MSETKADLATKGFPSASQPYPLHLFKYRYLYFLLIVLLGGAMRFAGLDRTPPGLFRDEAEKGYNAWAVAASGGVIELTGGSMSNPILTFKRWPWMINVNGTMTSAIYQYFDAPFVGLGGLNVANTRRAAALIGSLAIFATGLFAMRTWGIGTGLIIMIWLAVSPWHIVFSRWAQQSSFVPLFLALGFGGCLAIEQNRRWGWPLLGGAMGSLFYAYSGAQPFVLIWLPCLILIFGRRTHLRHFETWLGLVLFLLPTIPTLIITLAPGGSERLGRVAIWSGSDKDPAHLAMVFFRNYLSHFSPGFLFLHGDPQPRHGIPGYGVMTWLDTILLPAGLWHLFRRRMALRWAILTCILCGPIPAAITRESPHALRSFPMALPLVICSGLGLSWILSVLRERLNAVGLSRGRILTLVAAMLMVCVGAGLNVYLRYWRASSHDPVLKLAFQESMRAAWDKLVRQRTMGETIYIHGYFLYGPYFQLFHLRPPPQKVVQGGILAQNVMYFDPETENISRKVKPGDWVLSPMDPREPAIAQFLGIFPSEVTRAGEYWTNLEQVGLVEKQFMGQTNR